MSLAEESESDRRSSVRVKSLLPIKISSLNDAQLEVVQAKILDLAVLESDGMKQDIPNWMDRSDEIPREVLFMLYEIKAIRQQMTELQRSILLSKDTGLGSRWVVINDRGLFIPSDIAAEVEEGGLIEIQLQIPCLQTPEILAVGEVVRVSHKGFAITFRHISEEHSTAIMRYAIRRERQLARSERIQK